MNDGDRRLGRSQALTGQRAAPLKGKLTCESGA